MKYEVKGVKWIGNVRTIDANTFEQTINVTSGIVGQSYDGFTNTDTTTVQFPAEGMDAKQIAAHIQTKAAEFVAEKYPDIIEEEEA